MRGSLTIVGLGPGSAHHATVEATEVLRAAASDPNTRAYGSATVIPLAGAIAPHLGVQAFESLVPNVADRASAFETVVRRMMSEAFRDGQAVLHLVAGSPLVVDDLVRLLRRSCAASGVPLRIVHGMSFIEPMLDCVYWGGDPGLQLASAWAVAGGRTELDPRSSTLLYELGEATRDGEFDSNVGQTMLHELHERLCGWYPSDHRLAILRGSQEPDLTAVSHTFALCDLPVQVLSPLSNLWVPRKTGTRWEQELAPAMMGTRPSHHSKHT